MPIVHELVFQKKPSQNGLIGSKEHLRKKAKGESGSAVHEYQDIRIV